MKKRDSKKDTKYRAEDILDMPRNEGVEVSDEIVQPFHPYLRLPGKMEATWYASDMARAHRIQKKEDNLMKDASKLKVDPKLKNKSFQELFPRDRPWNPAKIAEGQQDERQKSEKNPRRIRKR